MRRVLRFVALALVAPGVAVLAPLTIPEVAAEPPATCDGLPATIVGTDGDDVMEGTEGPDVVSLGAGSDDFDGLGGDDVICAGEGDDEVRATGGRLFAGSGDDRIDVRGHTEAWTGAGRDRAEAGGDAHVRLGAGEDRGRVSSGAPVVDGGPGADRFDLWWEDFLDEDVVFSGARLVGGQGRDELHWEMDRPVRVDSARRTVTSPHRDAHVFGVHEFVGGDHADVMVGHRGHDHFVGGFGDDELRGGGGDDDLLGGRGRDVADGGPGVDVCRSEVRRQCEPV